MERKNENRRMTAMVADAGIVYMRVTGAEGHTTLRQYALGAA